MLDATKVGLLHSEHLKRTKELPDIQGRIVSIKDLQVHAQYKGQLREALQNLMAEAEANREIAEASAVAEAIVYELLDENDPKSYILAQALLLYAAEWLLEEGVDIEEIRELVNGMVG